MAGDSGFELNFKGYMDLAQTDPMKAAISYRDSLKKKKRPPIATIRLLDRIIQGDESAWHAGARDLTEAVQFIISNTMLKSVGLGVMNMQKEDIAKTIGGLISENVNFIPLNTTQKRCKMIAENYGFQVYTLNEEEENYEGDQINTPKNDIKVEITYDDGDSRGMSVLNDGTVLLWVSEAHSEVTVISTEDDYPTHISVIDANVDHPINTALQRSFESGEGVRESMDSAMIVLWEIARNQR